MVGNRLKAAMSDMAETIRRVFQAPASRSAPLAFQDPASSRVAPVTVIALAPPSRFEPVLNSESCLASAVVVALPLAWTATVQGEPGWAAWTTGAIVCELPLLRAERCQRLTVPALPRRAVPRRQVVEAMTLRARCGWEAFPVPPVRCLRAEWPAPKTYRALDQLLAMPMAVTGVDLQKISKALWMRYTLQLVRATGQNIRNLEMLGLYWIPAKGARQVHHDPATGRLLVTLGPEAAEARKAPFLLARQKDDNAVVCCFVEGT